MCSSDRPLVLRAFRFELDPNLAQSALLTKTVGASRFVYNWALAQSEDDYQLLGKRPSLRELKKRLVWLKKHHCPWLYEVSAHVGQSALKDLDEAFESFFKGLQKKGPRRGYPRFKRRGRADSARVYEVTLEPRHLRLPLIGRVRLKERATPRRITGRVLSATITRRADRWFVSLCVEQSLTVPRRRGVADDTGLVGLDLGLLRIAVIHDGLVTDYVEPRLPEREQRRRLRRLDRALARKEPGSNNRRKAALRRQRLHYKIFCRREDSLHQLSSRLAKTKRVIVVEDLQVSALQRNRHLARVFTDVALGKLRRQLVYKSEWYGSSIIVADRFYASTRACSRCGRRNESLRGFDGLKQRSFACRDCGLSLDRDENAARNLRVYRLWQLGIGPLPEGLREVTPAREEGSGSLSSNAGVKPASMKQEASGLAASGGRTRRSETKGSLVRVRVGSEPNATPTPVS
jgi:putative transposase